MRTDVLLRFLRLLLLSSFVPALLLACNREAGPPPPLAADQIASEFAKVFKDAKPEVKELADQVLKALEAKDYPTAHQAVQNLAGAPAATKDQQMLATRAFITITGLLQTAQAQGDQNAATALKVYKGSK